jgi:hypothetical protein
MSASRKRLDPPAIVNGITKFSTGSGVIVQEADGEHMYCVCIKGACQAEGERQRMDYMQRRWAAWAAMQLPQNGITK